MFNSFYGGQPGQDFSISYIFDNREALISDLGKGYSSHIGLNEYVMINYGLDWDTIDENKQKDKEANYPSSNNTLWCKIYDEEKTKTLSFEEGQTIKVSGPDIYNRNGLCYKLIAHFTSGIPKISVTEEEVDPAENRNINISEDLDFPLITFTTPREVYFHWGPIQEIEKTKLNIFDINEPYVTIEYSSTTNPGYGKGDYYIYGDTGIVWKITDKSVGTNYSYTFKYCSVLRSVPSASVRIKDAYDTNGNLQNPTVEHSIPENTPGWTVNYEFPTLPDIVVKATSKDFNGQESSENLANVNKKNNTLTINIDIPKGQKGDSGSYIIKDIITIENSSEDYDTIIKAKLATDYPNGIEADEIVPVNYVNGSTVTSYNYYYVNNEWKHTRITSEPISIVNEYSDSTTVAYSAAYANSLGNLFILNYPNFDYTVEELSIALTNKVICIYDTENNYSALLSKKDNNNLYFCGVLEKNDKTYLIKYILSNYLQGSGFATLAREEIEITVEDEMIQATIGSTTIGEIIQAYNEDKVISLKESEVYFEDLANNSASSATFVTAKINTDENGNKKPTFIEHTVDNSGIWSEIPVPIISTAEEIGAGKPTQQIRLNLTKDGNKSGTTITYTISLNDFNENVTPLVYLISTSLDARKNYDYITEINVTNTEVKVTINGTEWPSSNTDTIVNIIVFG